MVSLELNLISQFVPVLWERLVGRGTIGMLCIEEFAAINRPVILAIDLMRCVGCITAKANWI